MMAETGHKFNPTLQTIGQGASPLEPGMAPPVDYGGELHTHGDESVFIHEEVEAASNLVKVIRVFVMVGMLLAMLQLSEVASAMSADAESGQEHDLEHYGIFFQLFLLIIGMVVGYALEVKEVTVLAEAGGVLLVGMLAGFLIQEDESDGYAHDSSRELTHVSQFDVNFFFLFLLPPIILDAGFNMDEMQRRKLFQNIGPVCGLAFGGTVISTLAIATLMKVLGGVAVMTENGDGMTWLESLIFGSLISATDPVTVLAIFGKMGADRDLYALVFGESVLNDAVAIVLYKSFSMFNPHTCDTPGFPVCVAGAAAGLQAFLTFCKIFIGAGPWLRSFDLLRSNCRTPCASGRRARVRVLSCADLGWLSPGCVGCRLGFHWSSDRGRRLARL